MRDFDNYSSRLNSQNQDSRRHYEDGSEDYNFGKYKSKKPPKMIYGKPSSSDHCYENNNSLNGQEDANQIRDMSNDSNESEYLTNQRTKPIKIRKDNKDEILGFISSSH